MFSDFVYNFVFLMIGLLLGYSMCSDSYNQDIHDFQVEAIINECAHWTADGDFDWNGPSMEGLYLIEEKNHEKI